MGQEITIYWVTRDSGLIDRIRKRFGISAGITINGETVVEVDEMQLNELREYERQGLIQLRNKDK